MQNLMQNNITAFEILVAFLHRIDVKLHQFFEGILIKPFGEYSLVILVTHDAKLHRILWPI
jgi:hypothetical protein